MSLADREMAALHAPEFKLAMQALTTIWSSHGCRTERLPPGLQLWHCGLVAGPQDLDEQRALWTTRGSERQDWYADSAREQAKLEAMAPTPHKLSFATACELKAADFGSLSLRGFTIEHCGTMHGRMKARLRQWMLENGFDAVVRVNGDPTEVVIARPRSALVCLGVSAL